MRGIGDHVTDGGPEARHGLVCRFRLRRGSAVERRRGTRHLALDSTFVAPPKRKTGGGRTTPKGTRPGEQRIANPTENERGVHASTRYTPPVTSEMRAPKPWIPVLMVALFIIGMIVIILRNLVFQGNNWLTLVGLGAILGGLYTATKWR